MHVYSKADIFHTKITSKRKKIVQVKKKELSKKHQREDTPKNESKRTQKGAADVLKRLQIHFDAS